MSKLVMEIWQIRGLTIQKKMLQFGMNIHSALKCFMDKRDAILDAALDLFAERGFYGTAVPLIAEQAGVGAGTIYRYFENKEALVNALYQKWKEELFRATIENLPEDIPLRQNFHNAWMRQFEFAHAHPTVMKFLELHHHSPYLDDTSRELNHRVSAPLIAVFQQAQQDQIFKDIPAELLLAITQGIFYGMMKAYWQNEIDLTPEFVTQVEDINWQALCR